MPALFLYGVPRGQGLCLRRGPHAGQGFQKFNFKQVAA